MTKEREKLPRGEATYRRRVLAEERRKIPPDFIGQRIQSQQEAETRLQEVKDILGEDNHLAPKEKAILVIEKIWLEFRLGRFTGARRQSQVQTYLNTLEKEDLDVYTWLVGEQNGSHSPLAKIRDKVMPPTVVSGYHTKRRRYL